MSFRSTTTVGLALLSLLGCAEGFVPDEHEIADGAPVHIMPSLATLTAGSELVLRVRSDADNDFVFNPCLRLLEVQVDGRWREVEEDRTCPLPGMQLPSRGQVDALITLPPDLAAGNYRVRLTFSEYSSSGGRPQVSAPFRVRDPSME